jgi:hypothetical protein
MIKIDNTKIDVKQTKIIVADAALTVNYTLDTIGGVEHLEVIGAAWSDGELLSSKELDALNFDIAVEIEKQLDK